MPRTQRLSEYTARIAGHGSILANAALLIENTLSDRHMTTHTDNMAWMPIVGESIFRFDESDAARQQASPCLSFENPKLRNERVDTSSFERKSPAFLPSFEVNGGQQEVIFSVRMRFEMYPTSRFTSALSFAHRHLASHVCCKRDERPLYCKEIF